MKKSAVALFSAICLAFLCSALHVPAGAAEQTVSIENARSATATYLLNTLQNPQVGFAGGEWSVIGLARSNFEVPQSWYASYYKALVAYVQERNGVLHENKYTEYSRVILALSAIGKDPTDVGGYNLLEKLGDYNKVVWQGINGPIYALLALDSRDYEIPICKGAQVQTTRQRLIDAITSRQLSDGGFSLGGKTADPDTTAMVLQALTPYVKLTEVEGAIGKAITCLSKLQDSDGGYRSSGVANSESAAQAIVALAGLNINPETDSRFIKGGNSAVDNLSTFYISGGGFGHLPGDQFPSIMSTEQSFYALVAYERFLGENSRLYHMSGAKELLTPQSAKPAGLPEKSPDVMVIPVIAAGKSFDDIAGADAQRAIEALASRGIVSGTANSSFEPGRTMTRAEFSAAIVRALGLPRAATNAFGDVEETSWYAVYVDTACTYGIATGTAKTKFSPHQTITREQAAMMVARAAKLCGIDTDMNASEIRDMLAQFSDYTSSDSYARAALAFCYKNGILSQSALKIEPRKPVARAEIATMIYTLLQKAELI